MGFIKTGDSQKILSFWGSDGKILLCPNCKKPMSGLKVAEENVQVICECEDSEVPDA